MAGYAVRRCWLPSLPSLLPSSPRLVRLAPGDPVLIVLGGRRISPELIEQLRQDFGLVGDPITQYVAWLGRAVQFDFGESYKLKQEVGDLILARLPTTVELIALSVVLAVHIGIPLGVLRPRASR
jgi:ABC-type dipeptide/oligopeptide/nickel transport system permease component